MSATLTKVEVNYRSTPSMSRRCGTCSMYNGKRTPRGAAYGSCTLVKGVIDPYDTCDRWDQQREPKR